MKLLHISDLHIGKRVNEVSMLEEQAHVLEQIESIIESEKPEAVLIAGDVYDKSVPTAEAVSLFDHFLGNIATGERAIFIISGNHDSPERLAFAGSLLNKSGVHISPVFKGAEDAIYLEDAWGKVAFYLLPFVKPAHVRAVFPKEEIESYSDGIAVALKAMAVEEEMRSVLLCHQFVTGANTCESEELSVGGSDNVDGSLFDAFDYVALGHLHGAQSVMRPTMRYCGTPLKYSFSEVKHQKSVTLVTMKEKGDIEVTTLPLVPLHDMRVMVGEFDALTAKSFYETEEREDYLHITLTDEEDVPNAMGKLRTIYPNIMKLSYDNKRTRESKDILPDVAVGEKSPLVLFKEFYALQNNDDLSESQEILVKSLIESIWEGER